MKKLIAISLLAIHLFNLAGYSLATAWLINRSDDQFISHLDAGRYNEDALVEVKIALHLPYMQNSSAYERIDGSLEHDGVQYNYVKRRISNDTLSILCIPNEQKTSLVRQARDIRKEVNDFPAGKKDKNTSLKKSGLSSDFYPTTPVSGLVHIIPSKPLPAADYSPSLLQAFPATPEHPPCSRA